MVLDKHTKFCYNYDTLSRVTERTVKNATTNSVISTETFTYDAAGNITGDSADDTFVYDTKVMPLLTITQSPSKVETFTLLGDCVISLFF